MSAQYTRLPTYSDDVKTPLLEANSPIDGVYSFENQEQQRNTCARSGFLGRWRAKCAARREAKYGPPCDNPRCQKVASRRRKFRLIIFSLFGLFLLTHLFKGAYMLFNYPKHVQCYDITEAESTYQFPLPKKMLVGYNASNGTTSIVRDAEPSDNLTVKIAFESLEEGDQAMFCVAKFGRKAAFNAYTKEKGGVLPKLLSTTIVVPADARVPDIRFAPKRAGGCAEKMVRKMIKSQSKDEDEEK